MDAQPMTSGLVYRKVELPIGECLGRGWDLAMQNLGPFIGYTLILIAIHVGLAFIPIIGWIASWIISPALSAGYFVYIYKKLRGEPTRFEDFFGGMNFVGQLFLVGLVSGLLTTIGLLLCVIPGLYLALGYMFATFLVVSRNLDFWKAMELSRRAVTDNLISVLVFVLVLIGVNIAGLLACVVGLVLSIPLSFCASVIAFQMIFEEPAVSPIVPPPIPPPISSGGPIRIE